MAIDIIARALAVQALSGGGGGGGSTTVTTVVKKTVSWVSGDSLATVQQNVQSSASDIINLQFLSVGDPMATLVDASDNSYSFLPIQCSWQGQLVLEGAVIENSGSGSVYKMAYVLVNSNTMLVFLGDGTAVITPLKISECVMLGNASIYVYAIGAEAPTGDTYITTEQFQPVVNSVNAIESILEQPGASIMMVKQGG